MMLIISHDLPASGGEIGHVSPSTRHMVLETVKTDMQVVAPCLREEDAAQPLPARADDDATLAVPIPAASGRLSLPAVRLYKERPGGEAE